MNESQRPGYLLLVVLGSPEAAVFSVAGMMRGQGVLIEA